MSFICRDYKYNKNCDVFSHSMTSVCMEREHVCSSKIFETGFSTVSLFNTCSAYVWPWIWVKAVTSSHECMHHRAGVLIQTPPKNPVPWCRELLGLSQLLVTPSLSTHQWVQIRFSLSTGGKEMEIQRQELQFMHLNNASMFKKWPHGWEVIGFTCGWSGAGFLVFICENVAKWFLWLCDYLTITCLIKHIANR